MSRVPIRPLEDGNVIVGGSNIYHRFSRSAGLKAPALVHVHGFAISGTYLEPAAAVLARRLRNFVPDLPGSGRSGRPVGCRILDIEGMAAALADYCDVVGVRTASFAGNSLGCPVILELATLRPELIERVILISPAGGPNNMPIGRALGQMTRDAPREPRALFPIAIGDYVRFGPVRSLRLFRAMTRYHTIEAAGRLRVPTLLIIGDRDPLIRLDRIQAVFGGLPNATAVVIPGAHALNFSHPMDVATLIERFIEDCASDTLVSSVAAARLIVG